MLYASFNQDSTCFSCGNDRGFGIYNCEPPRERFSRFMNEQNGIGIVEMLYKSNILVLVGGGKNPKAEKNKVMIWDDCQNKCIADINFKNEEVTGVKLRRDTIIIATINKTYVYNFEDLKLKQVFNTYYNPCGILSISTGDDNVIGVLSENPGGVIVKNFTKNRQVNLTKTPDIIRTHDNPISQIAMDARGRTVSTCSEKGTIIRIWDTFTGVLMKELRRGIETTGITSMCFNKTCTQFAVATKKGSLHIFSLFDDDANRRSALLPIGSILPDYFSSEWSAITTKIPTNSICTFGESETLYVISFDTRCFYKYKYSLINDDFQVMEDLSISRLSKK